MSATGVPYHFIVLDQTTVLQPTQVTIDGKTADDWLSDRKLHTPGHGGNEEFMHWFVCMPNQLTTPKVK